MKYEKSCGAIIVHRDQGKQSFLILQHQAGHWSFPKGHVEGNETETETALREIWEETGLEVSINERFRLINHYSPRFNIMKEVVFFIAKSPTKEVQLQAEEIRAVKWCRLDDALQCLTYESDRNILIKANSLLAENSEFF